MDLLLRNIYSNTIYLISRWRINKMICCIHVTAWHIMQGHAATMVTAVYYTLIPAANSITYRF